MDALSGLPGQKLGYSLGLDPGIATSTEQDHLSTTYDISIFADLTVAAARISE